MLTASLVLPWFTNLDVCVLISHFLKGDGIRLINVASVPKLHDYVKFMGQGTAAAFVGLHVLAFG